MLFLNDGVIRQRQLVRSFVRILIITIEYECWNLIRRFFDVIGDTHIKVNVYFALVVFS